MVGYDQDSGSGIARHTPRVVVPLQAGRNCGRGGRGGASYRHGDLATSPWTCDTAGRSRRLCSHPFRWPSPGRPPTGAQRTLLAQLARLPSCSLIRRFRQEQQTVRKLVGSDRYRRLGLFLPCSFRGLGEQCEVSGCVAPGSAHVDLRSRTGQEGDLGSFYNIREVRYRSAVRYGMHRGATR